MRNKAFLRFCLVGLINTATDTIIFLVLHSAGLNIVIANIISTTVGLIVSLTLNYRFTFKGKSLGARQIALYVAVTLVGLWALAPVVIQALLTLDDHFGYARLLSDHLGHADSFPALLAKLGSVAVTLVWNYAWYSRIVFKDRPKLESAERAIKDI